MRRPDRVSSDIALLQADLPYWRCHLCGKILVRLQRLLGQVGIELAKLGRVTDVTFVSRSCIFRLHLERFVRRVRQDDR
jgi:hypothetical protein